MLSLKTEGVWCEPCALFFNGKNKPENFKNIKFGRFVSSPAMDYSKIARHMQVHDKTEYHKMAITGIENLREELRKGENTLSSLMYSEKTKK